MVGDAHLVEQVHGSFALLPDWIAVGKVHGSMTF